jgi:hypothetical protein
MEYRKTKRKKDRTEERNISRQVDTYARRVVGKAELAENCAASLLLTYSREQSLS